MHAVRMHGDAVSHSNRREFLRVASLGLAALGAAACTHDEMAEQLAKGGPVMLTLQQASAAIFKRQLSPVELTERGLDRISRLPLHDRLFVDSR
ncbi:MAG: hypothetical protein ABI120_02260 [Gemmatimonadaceae bacterium]